ncbi:hypothetical protein [Bremerella sp.]|uniref:hypothetical protein n=1 Tax=Bremerella sp. TaxID=2795602 RepID=UPI0039188DC7
MSSSPAQPGPKGAFSGENACQVVVRAGKTFLCSACGTMVEVPAEVVGQLVIAVNPSPPKEPPETSVSRDTPSSENPSVEDQRPQAKNLTTTRQIPSPAQPVVMQDRPAKPVRSRARPPRPKRPQPPRPNALVGTLIDGLKVPSAKELDRAFAWVSFHLRVLDRQAGELKRLTKLRKQRDSQTVPCPATQPDEQKPQPQSHVSEPHSHEDVRAEADTKRQNERGPP